MFFECRICSQVNTHGISSKELTRRGPRHQETYTNILGTGLNLLWCVLGFQAWSRLEIFGMFYFALTSWYSRCSMVSCSWIMYTDVNRGFVQQVSYHLTRFSSRRLSMWGKGVGLFLPRLDSPDLDTVSILSRRKGNIDLRMAVMKTYVGQRAGRIQSHGLRLKTPNQLFRVEDNQ